MSKKPKSKAITEVSTAELGKLLGGLSARSIRALAERGDVVRIGVGRYDKWKSITAYCASQRKAAAGRTSPVAEQRARMVALQADALKRLNGETAAEYVNAAEAAQRWVEITERIRLGVLEMQARIRKALPGLDEAGHAVIAEELEAAISVLNRPAPLGRKRQ